MGRVKTLPMTSIDKPNIDLRGLARFADYAGRRVRAMVWYLGREPKRLNGVEILPWQQGLEAMGW
jgi:hypothetical protein